MPETGRVAAGVREHGMWQETDAKRGRPPHLLDTMSRYVKRRNRSGANGF